MTTIEITPDMDPTTIEGRTFAATWHRHGPDRPAVTHLVRVLVAMHASWRPAIMGAARIKGERDDRTIIWPYDGTVTLAEVTE